MKKSSLTTAVLAGLAGVVGFAGSSNAVELNPDGTGQVLIYPYYTVNAGQQTLISVVNSTAVGKAVKVRFLEGYDSKEVLDFNLFLSPYDVWTATIFALADAGGTSEGAAVMNADNSCTVPAFTQAPFSNALFTGAASDSGPTDISRTREGYIEMIAMADVTGDTLDDITHDATGVPADCASLALRDIGNTDFIPPAGGLFGNGYIVNVPDGTMYAYNADAIDGFTDTVLFTNSGSTTPSLQQVNGGGGPTAVVAHVFLGGGTLQTLTYPQSQAIDAVSAVFQASALMNTWVANEDASFGTDWVVTFPTKRFYVNPPVTTPPTGATAPFVEVFGESGAGQSCVVIDATVYDREEGSAVFVPGDVFSPAPADAPPSSLCHEVNVITISDPTDPMSVLGSPYETAPGVSALAVNIPPFGEAGWMYLDLNPVVQPHALRDDAAGISLSGLPATGFNASRFINTNVTPGVLANYSGAFRHRVERTLAS